MTGGAFYLQLDMGQNTRSSFSDVLCVNNVAWGGGGCIGIVQTAPSIMQAVADNAYSFVRMRVIGNLAGSSSSNDGGGVVVMNAKGFVAGRDTVEVVDCWFENNVAGNSGGGFAFDRLSANYQSKISGTWFEVFCQH